MLLYSTKLLIKGFVVQYEVYKEGGRLFFKPLKNVESVDVPIFWAAKIDDVWKPMNIGDEEFVKQVQDVIQKHDINSVLWIQPRPSLTLIRNWNNILI